MTRPIVSLRGIQGAALGGPTLFSTLSLAACATGPTELANNRPNVCGGDFGLLGKLEYEHRGNPPAGEADAYTNCGPTR